MNTGDTVLVCIFSVIHSTEQYLQIHIPLPTDGKVCPCEKDCPDAFHALMSDLPSDDVSTAIS